MKVAAAFAFAATALAVPSGKDLVELSMTGAQDFLPGQHFYPQRSLKIFGGLGNEYTEETFRAEAVKQCKADPACSTVVGFYQEKNNIIPGTVHPVWLGFTFGGAKAVVDNFFHDDSTCHSFVYTINE